MAKISVIIPVYNVEDYLNKCLDSIINQTFKDIEIICVNDGSKDNSLQIVKEYAQKDNRIKIVDKENGGLSSARNAGLEVATSEWISFIDSDDWLDIDTFEKIEKIFELNPDIICFGTHLRGEVAPEIASADAEYYRIKHTGLVELNDEIRETTDVATWNKLYKKSIIDKFNLRFPMGKHYEDYPFYWEYMFEAKTAFYTEEKFYNYLRRPNSIMANTFNQKSEKVIDHLYAAEIIFNYCQKRGILEEHLETFAEIFMNCFWFSYDHSPKKRKTSVLFQATELLNKFALGNDFNDKWNNIIFLKAGQYYKIGAIDYDKNIWQKIFSIRNRRGKKIVKIFGLKFSFKHKKEIRELNDRLNNLNEIIKNQDENIANLTKLVNEQYEYNHNQFNYFQNIEYETAYNIWISQGATLELCNRLSYLSQSEYQWNIQNNKLWLIYISCLVETKNNKKALDILNKYLKKWGLTDIDRFVLVSKFAKENNITSAQIEKTYFIYNYMNNIRNNNVIEELLKGKSVAIVGNGPSEIGKNKGKEIDSHDIVIRINNYVISGYENDYGTKTNIWVRGSGSPQVEDRTQHNEYLAVLWEADYEHFPIFFNHIDILYRDAKNNIIFSNFDFRIHKEIKEKSKINFPTSGLMCIYWLHSLKLKKLSYYGFSFLDGANKNIHYYKDEDEQLARNFIEPHSLAEETDFIRKVLNV